jgi:hypothetical protein
MLCAKGGDMKLNNVFWGNPKCSDYESILDYYSGTKINSIRTSSVPLAQYWKNTGKVLGIIDKELGIGSGNADVYFEYPTKSTPKNKSSMSDVMIITGKSKIAIEAKYTEYAKSKYEAIGEWLKTSDSENRRGVLEHWISIIKPYSSVCAEGYLDLPYQLLHRTASACFGKPESAYVIFQLFWDSKTEKHLGTFTKKIQRAVDIVKPNDRLKYFIHLIEIKDIRDTDMNDVFQIIKSREVYVFGREEIRNIRCA